MDWLVFKQVGEVHAYTCSAGKCGEPWCVEAEDESAAAMVVMGATQNIGKYVVIPAVVVDLGAGDPRGDTIIDTMLDQRHR